MGRRRIWSSDAERKRVTRAKAKEEELKKQELLKKQYEEQQTKEDKENLDNTVLPVEQEKQESKNDFTTSIGDFFHNVKDKLSSAGKVTIPISHEQEQRAILRLNHLGSCSYCGSILSSKETLNGLCDYCIQFGCQEQATIFKYYEAHEGSLEEDTIQYMKDTWIKNHCSSCNKECRNS